MTADKLILSVSIISLSLALGVTATAFFLLARAIDALTKITDAASAWLYADTIAKEKKPK